MTRYDALYECYITGQIGDDDMTRLMREDQVFAAFVKHKDATRLTKGKPNG